MVINLYHLIKLKFLKEKKKKISSRIINIKEINKLPSIIKKNVLNDLKKITSKRKLLKKKDFLLMGVLNMTPDSFSDGGKFNSLKKAINRIKEMISSGADIIDIGGESTRPGSQIISQKTELKRVEKIIKIFKKKFPNLLLSVDTRKSLVMEFSMKYNMDIINDVSCFSYDKKSFDLVKDKNLWKIIHHMQGTPQTMQINPTYNNVLLDIYDFFEKKNIQISRTFKL